MEIVQRAESELEAIRIPSWQAMCVSQFVLSDEFEIAPWLIPIETTVFETTGYKAVCLYLS